MKGSGRKTLAAVDGALLITSNSTMTVWTATPRSDFHLWRSCLWRASACVASLIIFIFSAGICGGSTPKQADETDIGRKETSEGLVAFERGDFDRAISHWEKAVRFYRAQHDSLHEIDARIRLATAYEGIGQFSDAIGLLNDAASQATVANDRQRMILAKSHLGEAYSYTRHSDFAETNLREALALALADQDLKTAAAIHNSLGNLLAAQDKLGDALEAYLASASSSSRMENRSLIPTWETSCWRRIIPPRRCARRLRSTPACCARRTARQCTRAASTAASAVPP